MAPMKSPTHQEVSDDLQDSITLTHLAKRWKVSRRSVRRMLQIGELPFVQVAGRIRVPIAAVCAKESEQI